MAVVNTKTTQLTNQDAAADPFASNGRQEMVQVATIEVAAADDDTSVYRLLRLPSAAVLTSIKVANDALGTNAAYEIGIFQTAANGGAVVDADEFATLAMVSASAWREVLDEAAATDCSKIGKPLWERIGLTADSARPYDLVAYGATAGDAAGTISAVVRYYIP
jgi:hypothetical protein